MYKQRPSDLPCKTIIASVLGSDLGVGSISTLDGNLTSTVAVESLDRDRTEGSTGEANVIAPSINQTDLGRSWIWLFWTLKSCDIAF